MERTIDEGEPCTTDHIHSVSKLIEASREYKMLCLSFVDLKDAFDSVEAKAVMEASDNQGVPTQCIKVFRELHSNLTTKISDVIRWKQDLL
ncbi:hypothetical protein RB195_000254 [Necator americanus]|uniref:Reverse transcriptase domain-containing protein n=1 Tax=Necator americanus TaxID=51031 RepID=A0ABR1DAG5_NECAM